MALGDTTLVGEVYRVLVTRVQEQEIEVEILEDGEDLHDAAWETVDSGSWVNVSRQIETIERVTCEGAV